MVSEEFFEGLRKPESRDPWAGAPLAKELLVSGRVEPASDSAAIPPSVGLLDDLRIPPDGREAWAEAPLGTFEVVDTPSGASENGPDGLKKPTGSAPPPAP